MRAAAGRGGAGGCGGGGDEDGAGPPRWALERFSSSPRSAPGCYRAAAWRRRAPPWGRPGTAGARQCGPAWRRPAWTRPARGPRRSSCSRCSPRQCPTATTSKGGGRRGAQGVAGAAGGSGHPWPSSGQWGGWELRTSPGQQDSWGILGHPFGSGGFSEQWVSTGQWVSTVIPGNGLRISLGIPEIGRVPGEWGPSGLPHAPPGRWRDQDILGHPQSSRGVEDIPGTAEESWAHSWVFLWQRGSSGHPEGKEESQGIFGSKGSSGHPLCIPRAVRVLQTSPGGRRHIASLPTKPHGMRSVIWGVGRHH